MTVSRFWLRKFVVTNAEYRLFGPHHQARFGAEFDRLERPVVNVDWYMATMFCRWLGEGYGVPTEAQWEAACRANPRTSGGSLRETEYWFGDREGELVNHAWYGNWFRKGNAERRTYSFSESLTAGGHENRWGLLDMHGNVWEWCHDWYYEYDRQVGVDPSGPSRGSNRVYRGGSWDYSAWGCRSAVRFWRTPDHYDDDLDFRLSLVPSRGG